MPRARTLLILPIKKVRTFILHIMRVRTFNKGKMKVRNLLLALSIQRFASPTELINKKKKVFAHFWTGAGAGGRLQSLS